MEEPSADTLVDEHQDATYTTQKWKCKSRFVNERKRFLQLKGRHFLKMKCIEQQTKEKERFHRTEFSSDRIDSTIGYQQFEQIWMFPRKKRDSPRFHRDVWHSDCTNSTERRETRKRCEHYSSVHPSFMDRTDINGSYSPTHFFVSLPSNDICLSSSGDLEDDWRLRSSTLGVRRQWRGQLKRSEAEEHESIFFLFSLYFLWCN